MTELTDTAAGVEAYLRDTSSSDDPYPAYRRLRDVAPIYWSEANDSWIVTGYAEGETLLRDRRLSRYLCGQLQFGWLGGPDDPPEVARAVNAWLATVLNLDPPEHTRLRRLMSQAFTPRAVARWHDRTVDIVDEVIGEQVAAAAGADGHLDLVNQIGYPIPETVICEILGVPASDHDRWKAWATGLNQAAIMGGMAAAMGEAFPVESRLRAQQSVANWYAYFAELIAARHGRPGDDLISVLVKLEEEGEQLSEQELVGTLILLIGAGHDTTANLFGNAMLALMRHPDEYARLRADPSLASSALEEALRFDGSARGQPRMASDDIEIDGHHIRAGQMVAVLVNAANRDPRRFPDPERFDITRADTGHLAFSTGIHFCLGAALARMEVAVELAAVARLPYRFELADDSPLQYKRSHARNLVSLPARLVPA